MSGPSRLRYRRALAAPLALLFILAVAPDVAAWSYSSAVNYANNWWDSTNTAWNSWPDDCANFVSQSVFAGGYPMNYSTNNPWYGNYGQLGAYSRSWSVVQNNRGFFLEDVPGGYVVYTAYGIKKASSSAIGAGEIVYYSWYGDRTFATDSHEALVTVTNGYARTTPSDYGALVDAHTNSRYHEYWSLYYWNANWFRTYYEVMHISANN